MEPFNLVNEPIPYFVLSKWTNLLPSISVGFTSRIGGISKSHYQSMNLALHVGDNESDVISNRSILANMLGFSFDAWTSAEQTHSNRIKVVTSKHRGKGRFSLDDAILDTDGIITNLPDILLTSYYADCVPLYFFDWENKIIGLAHAGWKGTSLLIAKEMVHIMTQTFQAKVENIRTAIGPSISKCCYEVDDKVIVPIKKKVGNIPEGAIIDKKNGHYDLDLKKINKQILINAGILPNNIEISNWCTSCNTDLFFSHRKENGNTGRMASWIGLRKDD